MPDSQCIQSLMYSCISVLGMGSIFGIVEYWGHIELHQIALFLCTVLLHYFLNTVSSVTVTKCYSGRSNFGVVIVQEISVPQIRGHYVERNIHLSIYIC